MAATKQLKYEKALEYEIFVKEEYGFAKEVIKKANCIFDIWWHIWLFSKWCRGLNLDANIYYFEPIKENYQKAYNLLWEDKSINLYNLWLASEKRDGVLLYNSEKTMQSSQFSSFLNADWKEEKVSFIRFQDAVKLARVKSIDLVKIDIEGMEFEVLNSLTDKNWWLIKNLIIEVHLLNKELEEQWNSLHENLKEEFTTIEIIPSWYSDKVFLIRAHN